MGFLGFKTAAEKKAENDAIVARAKAKAEAAMAPPTPPAEPAAPAAVSATPAGTMTTGVGAIVKPRVPDELKNYKDGGVISPGEKKLLKQKALVKQKRGC